jgi:hypothetical protein
LADFVVLSKDILTAPPAEILNTKVLLTVMGEKTDIEIRIFSRLQTRVALRQPWGETKRADGNFSAFLLLQPDCVLQLLLFLPLL